MSYKEERNKRTAWMMHDRFGLFIHWGLYAVPAIGEWKQSYERIPTEEYKKYFDEFDPVDYNPAEWAKAAAAAGMKYAVLTAKHHEGFCLFDSAYTDFKSTNTKCKKDLVREYVDAFRSVGLKIGLYYSLFDWHHKDYPHYGDLYHPMRDNESYKDYQYNFDNYLAYMHNQVRELLTNYGKIDLFWFDNSYGKMVGEVWKSTELVIMMRSLQPDIILNNRLEVNASSRGSIGTSNPSVFSGDFVAPEQIVPPQGICDDTGEPLPWEANCTMNNNWGYVTGTAHYKSAKVLIRKLVECVSKGGNLLVNVGPDGRGNIPEKSIKIMKRMAHWMKKYSDSLYGCGRSVFSKPEWGYYTQKGNTVYAHIFDQCIGPIPLQIPTSRIKSIHNMYDYSEVPIVRPWTTQLFPDYTFVNFGNPPQATFELADEIDTVLKIELTN
ncbi:alpha-L-fucosidase [Treponema sp. HNW]|uniref:alpha-L-fucosidase n=1 Tax=Treponema sp. HNW TaxID=3116654 RepID=UPI003D0C784C